MPLTKQDIENAYKRIVKQINRTPVLISSQINSITGAELYFKCENFQKVGAFKYRGASNTLLLLSKERRSKGVATHSSGNHAQALALVAKNLGVKAYIVMPENSPSVKITAVEGYGAEITFCKPTLEARESTLQSIIDKYGAEFIHPYNREEIITGQGTASLELLEEVPNLDIIITPVGGGGLLSGTAIYSKNHNSKIKVYGAEPQGASDAHSSLHQQKIIPSINPQTICDGLLTSLGTLTFDYISNYVDDILLANDKQVIEAMKLIYERMKIIVEPSSAITLAVVIANPDIFVGRKVGLILSGGNVDMQVYFDWLNNKVE